MRKLILLPVLAALLVGAPSTLAATKTVSITNAGFVPNAVSIETGDSITWTNSDSKNRQPISQEAAFASPILKPGETFTHTFKEAGKYTVTDALVKNQRLTVTVTAPAPVGSPSLTSSKSQVVYGAGVLLTGKVPTAKSGESVTLRGEVVSPAGTRETSAIAETTTSADGSFSFRVTPSAQTSYTVAWQATPATSTTSDAVTVLVAPRVGVGVVRKVGPLVTFSVKVTSARGYSGRSVYLQKRNRFGEWISVKRVVLRSNTVATRSTVSLPKGLSRIRVLLPKSQAGIGYVAGISRTVLVVR